MALKKQFLYQKLAARIADQIQEGIYEPGQKLPSISKLTQTLNKSVSTVYRAYVELEFLGLVEARPKSGYYVKASSPREKKCKPNAPLPIFSAGKDLSDYADEIRLAIKQPSFVPLGQAILSPELLPQKHISKIIKAISPKQMQSLISYGEPQGELKLRRQIARRMMGQINSASPDSIVITNGCMEAVALSLMTVTEPGDTVALESPTYFGYMQILKELKLSIVEIPTLSGHGIDLDALSQATNHHKIRACLLIPNFQNPQGGLMPDANKRRLVRLASDKGIFLIEDDVYSELHYGSSRPSLLKTFDRQGITITCSSFSKTLCPGFRLGWVMAEGKTLEQIKKLKFSISMATSSLNQHIICQLLESNRYDRHLRSLRARVKNQVRAVAGVVKKIFPNGTRVRLPQGGFVLWVKLPEDTDSLRLYQEALNEGIAILPGFLCAYSQNWKRYIRINCGFPFDNTVQNALVRLGQLAKAQIVSSKTGTDK